jgi:glycosyltransferase involved in cell wall biosynthesis
MRKNIEFALEIVKKLCEMGRNPLLLITGAGVANNTASQHYGQFLRQSMSKDLLSHIVFVSDFFVVQDDTLRDLYLLSDCLLFPSKQEGFGLPIIEAGLYRLPIWCRDIPAFEAVEGEGAFMLTDLAKLPDAVYWLETIPTFRLQRKARRQYDPATVYTRYYEPLLPTLLPEKP